MSSNILYRYKKVKIFMIQSNVTHSYIKVKDLRNREPMYMQHVLYYVSL